LSFEQAIDYYAIFGGIEDSVELEFFDDIFQIVEKNFAYEFEKFQEIITPSYILDTPYDRLLTNLAKGDSKVLSAFFKSKLGERSGGEIVEELVENRIIYIEKSRENPLKIHPKYKLKKELRSYKIQDKARFVLPFYRFWFGFVMPYKKELQMKQTTKFMDNFKQHYERLRSYIFEQLSLEVLHIYFDRDRLLSWGSYWDKDNEFDILALTSSHKIILSECKYKDRKVCKNELNKLKQKAIQSGIKVDKFILFSKSGFSNELLASKSRELILFDLEDMKRFLY